MRGAGDKAALHNAANGKRREALGTRRASPRRGGDKSPPGKACLAPPPALARPAFSTASFPQRNTAQ